MGAPRKYKIQDYRNGGSTNMKLQIKNLDFEALIKDLPKSNPLIFVTEVSNIYNIHMLSLKPRYKNNAKEV